MVYLFLAEGFEEAEALIPVDLLRRASISVTTVGVGSKNICGAHGISVIADITDKDLPADLPDLEMVVLPGGMPGTTNLDACPAVDAALKIAAAQNSFIAAICAAPMILGKRGLLQGKQAVCYPGFETELTGATLSTSGVAEDDHIITAKAAGYAVDFAFALIHALRGADTAKQICEAICP